MKIININIKTLLIYGLASTMLWACGTQQPAAETQEAEVAANEVHLTKEQYEIAGVKTGKAEKRVLGSELIASGKIGVPPQSDVSVSMPYGGFVKYIDLLPGTPIKKGQLLLKLENPEFIQFQQNYMEAWSRRSYLETEYERQQRLYEENVASAKNFQQAKSAFLSNEAQIMSMEERLRMIGFDPVKVKNGNISGSVNVYSPVTGAVREVFANLGKYVNPQDVIVSITDASDLHVELTVYENDISKVEKGQKIYFNHANANSKWREAEVFLVGKNVREDRSVTVHGHIHHSLDAIDHKELLPGMYITARIVTGSHDVVTLPEDAVVRFSGKHYVFVLQENGPSGYQFEMAEVTTGISEDGYIEVNYVNPSRNLMDDELVLDGAFSLLATAKNHEEEE